MDTNRTVTALAALAQSSRLAVFRLLIKRGPEGACPSEIAGKLGLPSATLSFHLKALEHAGLIYAEQRGRSIRYRANVASMQTLMDDLTENCCGGDFSKCSPAIAKPRTANVVRIRER